MKHLKSYKIFERQTEEHLTLMDIYQDFFDKWGYEMPDYARNSPWSYNITLSSKKMNDGLPRFEISDGWVFSSGPKNCVKIRITNSGGRNHKIKKGVFKDFDGISDVEFAQDLKECHERAIEYLNPVDTIVGSLGVHTKDLDIIYFKEKPDFSRCGDVEIYGSNTAIHLDKLGYWLLSNSRHHNGFDVYDENWQIKAMPFLMGYGDPDWFYYGPGEIMDRDPGSKITEWINKEWEKVCKLKNIKSYQKVGDEEKITVPEFMTHLRDNQETYGT